MSRNIAQTLRNLLFSFFKSKVQTKPPGVNCALVRSVKDEEYMSLAFTFKFSNKKNPKHFLFNRLKNGDIDSTLEQVSKKINKYVETIKYKNKNIPDDIVFSVFLVDKNKIIKENPTNEHALKPGRILEIGPSKYEIILNLPTVNSIKIKEKLFSGFAICPDIDVEFVDSDKCEYVWYRSFNPGETISPRQRAKLNVSTNINIKWIEVGKGYYYTPSDADIGFLLKVVCTPSDETRSGFEKTAISKFVVAKGPGLHLPFHKRHTWTKKTTGKDSLRVVSYNILANTYSSTKLSTTVLYTHCPEYALSMDYRKHLLCKEISGYNADLVCLQEVDTRWFEKVFEPFFQKEGFTGSMLAKFKDIKEDVKLTEGVATFFRKSKLRFVEQQHMSIANALINDECYKDLWEKISQKETFKEEILHKPTVLQITVLQSVHRSNQYVIVGCTHLTFRPDENLLRLLQTMVCVTQLEKLKTMYQEQGNKVSVMLCGDLNSVPQSGAIDLLKYGKIPPEHSVWLSGGPDRKIDQFELKHNLQLISACGYPNYTCHTTLYRNCIDYIFIEKDKFDISQVVPMISHEEITKRTALPNTEIPSDHLALVCDLKWRK